MPIAPSQLSTQQQLRMDFDLSPELQVVDNSRGKGALETAFAPSSTPDKFSRPQRRIRRNVTFNEEVYVQETKHINDMDDDEVDSIWYAREDYKQMKMNYMVTVRIMMSGRGIPQGNSDHCSRGLEYRTRDGARRRQMNKLNAITAVLDEQERQRIIGIESAIALMNVYVRTNVHCREASHKMGVKDARDADYSEVLELMQDMHMDDVSMDSSYDSERSDVSDNATTEKALRMQRLFKTSVVRKRTDHHLQVPAN
eukprot:CAMPEP_0194042438 /NCGR_PEP_ID=MMETSP0009_2-20130614/14209_1 /TAXON_ID=210454 /ORGANISM="Grammatophora oceanica, Strain CCMP 410" /LENGTH=254 /DNA_ID=CAMNT_0038686281 /DNA_START=139 /DNA_END=903 /DNA_ORIENTATION=+